MDAIDQQIAAHFVRHVADSNNSTISAAIGALFAQKKDYSSALAWYEHAFQAGGCVDCALERTIQDLKAGIQSGLD